MSFLGTGDLACENGRLVGVSDPITDDVPVDDDCEEKRRVWVENVIEGVLDRRISLGPGPSHFPLQSPEVQDLARCLYLDVTSKFGGVYTLYSCDMLSELTHAPVGLQLMALCVNLCRGLKFFFCDLHDVLLAKHEVHLLIDTKRNPRGRSLKKYGFRHMESSNLPEQFLEDIILHIFEVLKEMRRDEFIRIRSLQCHSIYILHDDFINNPM